MAVNVSGSGFTDTSLATYISHVLRAHGAEPECLTIELTETVDLPDLTVAHRIMRTLQQSGIAVALDDFGTAYATFQRLRFLPFDELKLDREVMIAATSPVGTAFVHAVVELARDLGMRVVAEGIETAERAEVARTVGCAHGQGYLYSPARPAADITRMLQSGIGSPFVADRQADGVC